MGLIPTGQARALLQWWWSDGVGSPLVLRNRTMDDLLDDISSTGPTANKYYLDVTGAEIAALLNAVTGAGSISPLGVSAGATASLVAAAGTGSISDLAAYAGAGISTSLTAAAGTGSIGALSVAAGAGASLTAASGAGAAVALTVSTPDTTAPTVTAFTVGTPSGSSVPVSSFTASDAVGVTGYLITESSTPPASGAAGWVGSAPSTYTAVGTGSVTLYPWAKDAAGNVSSVFGSPRTVTISAGTAPLDDFSTDLLATKYLLLSGSVFSVSGGRLHNSTSANAPASFSGHACVRNDVTVGANCQVQAVIRAANASNNPGVYLNVVDGGGGNVWGNRVVVDGSYLRIYTDESDGEGSTWVTLRGSLPLGFTFQANTDYKLLVVNTNGTITAKVNGTALTGSVGGCLTQSGRAGLAASGGYTTDRQWDDLWIATNTTDTPP